MNITKDIKYIGVNDHEVDLFEGQYVVPNGMSYNSYVIIDQKVAVMTPLTQDLPMNGWIISKPLWVAEPPTTWWCNTWSLTTLPTSIILSKPIPTPKLFLPPRLLP